MMEQEEIDIHELIRSCHPQTPSILSSPTVAFLLDSERFRGLTPQ